MRGQIAVLIERSQVQKGFSCAGVECTRDDSPEALPSGNARSGFWRVGFSLPWAHIWSFVMDNGKAPSSAPAAVPGAVPAGSANPAACSGLLPSTRLPASLPLEAEGRWVLLDLGCGGGWLWLLLIAMKLSPKH